jgi:RNA polymerase sigma-70 factor (ECF subfamily)
MGAKTEQRESETRALGDLLCGNNTKVRVSEQDWGGLVASIATGDQVALHALYEQTHRIVFTLIARIINNRESAEELTVDVFYDVWRKASSYDPANASVVGWIMNQARSRAIDRLRFEHRKKRLNTDGDTTLITRASNDPHQASQLEEQGRLLRAALELLTPEERQVIETAFFSELTYEEVATRLQQPIGTVKTRIRSGLGKLRQALAAIAGAL